MSISRLSLLQDNEEKLMLALNDVDLVSFSNEMHIHGVISSKVRDDFASLDHRNLDLKLQISYLLHQVLDNLKDDMSSFSMLIKAFRSFGGNVSTMGDELEGSLSLIEGAAETSAVTQTEAGRKRSRDLDTYILSESDVGILTEILHEASYLWEQMGIALGLSKNEREDCRNAINVFSLDNIIRKWITVGNMKKRSVSLFSLKEALSGPIFANTVIVSKLEGKFYDLKWKKVSVVSKKQHLDSNLSIVQPKNTEVAYGKSALLKVQGISKNPINYEWRKDDQILVDSNNYSGTNNNILFISSVIMAGKYSCRVYSDIEVKYSDTVTLTVVYRPVSEHLFAIYSHFSELPEDAWPPVTATEYINLAMITKSKLKTDKLGYAIQGDLDDIIDPKKKIEYEDVFGKFEVGTLLLVEGRPGSGKTTLMHKVTRDWAMKRNILRDAEVVILVPLRLLTTVYFRNSQPSNIDPKLLKIRAKAKGDITLSHMFENYFDNCDRRKAIIEEIEESSGKGLCLIIDGLDEYERRNRKGSVLYKLLHKTYLPHSMIIVASRPIGTANLRRNCTKRIEVLGFSNDQIFNYIKKYEFEEDSTSTSVQLEAYLKSHRNVLRMCYLPVHVAMVCFLYSQKGYNIPHTETKIYEDFTLLTISRSVKRSSDGKCIKARTINELDGDVRATFWNICKLAFSMTESSKQVVHQSEISVSLSKSACDALGLVTIDSSAKFLNTEDFYTFLHLTFQEYLTAIYIAELTPDEQLQHIEMYKESSNFLLVWKFYCGTTVFGAEPARIEKIMACSNINTLSKIQYAFESQQNVVCNSIFSFKTEKCLFFKDNTLTSTDFHALGYVITEISEPVIGLDFDDCRLDADGIIELSQTRVEKITKIGFHKVQAKLEDFENLTSLLSSLPSLENIDLCGTEIGPRGYVKLFGSFIFRCLKTLAIRMPFRFSLRKYDYEMLRFRREAMKHIHCEYYKSHDVLSEEQGVLSEEQGVLSEEQGVLSEEQCLEKLMTHCNSQIYSSEHFLYVCNAPIALNDIKEISLPCTSISLINCFIDDIKVQDIINHLQHNLVLQRFSLDFNQVTGNGAMKLAEWFKNCHKLEVFSAHCNQIDDAGALELVKVFSTLENSKTLDLHCNPITEDGMDNVVETMQHLPPKFELYLGNANTAKKIDCKLLKSSVHLVSNGDVEALTIALKCCTYLPQFGIYSYNASSAIPNIKWLFGGHDSSLSLARGLEGCTNLQTMYLTGLNLNIVAFSRGLQYCNNLEILKLCRNNIGLEGAVALGNELIHCKKLQALDLSNNIIGPDGVKGLVAGIEGCDNLNTLRLTGNMIGQLGMKVVFNTLAALEVLDLNNCGIGPDIALALTSELKCGPTLRILYLNSNSITSGDAIALSGQLGCCYNLEEVHLQNHRIDSTSAETIATNLEILKKFKLLDLAKNGLASKVKRTNPFLRYAFRVLL